jgi:hypothetical protein
MLGSQAGPTLFHLVRRIPLPASAEAAHPVRAVEVDAQTR